PARRHRRAELHRRAAGPRRAGRVDSPGPGGDGAGAGTTALIAAAPVSHVRETLGSRCDEQEPRDYAVSERGAALMGAGLVRGGRAQVLAGLGAAGGHPRLGLLARTAG